MEHSKRMDTKIDYSKYSFDELNDIKQNIDKSKLFELWNKIQSQLPAVSSIVKIANGILKLITQSS